MKKNLIISTLFFVFIIFSVLFIYSFSVSVEEGKTQTDTIVNDINNSSMRIVCLNNDAATILILLDRGDWIVGASDSFLSNNIYKEKCPNAESIGGDPPDFETIISLQPDLVLSSHYVKPVIIERINNSCIPVDFIDGWIIEKIPDEVSYLGNITGSEEKAGEYIKFYNNILETIENRVNSNSNIIAPLVYFENSARYSTVAKGSGGNSLIELAHGNNIAGDIDTTWPIVSGEWIVGNNPDIFIKIAYSKALANFTMREIRENIIMDPKLETIDAVKEGHVYILNHGITYNTVGIVSLMYLAKVFYPEHFEDIDPDVILKEYSEKFVPVSDIENSIYPKFWK